MRKAELRQLAGYTDYVWNEFRRTVPESLLTQKAPGSGWPTLEQCLGHMIAAHGRWVPAIVDSRAGPLPEFAPGELDTWEKLELERYRLRSALSERLETWSDDELAIVRDVEVFGESMRYSRGELIAHLLLHERGHHGDVTTLFWQIGFEPDVALEYRFFLGRHSPDA